MRKIVRFCIVALMLVSACQIAFAQTQEDRRNSEKKTNFSLATNLLQWANFATPNLELNISVHRKFTLNAGARLNSWEFKDSKHEIPIWNKQQTYYGGLRYWPWYVYSGFWIGAKGQYSKASNTGLWRQALEEYTGAGAGLSLGYTLMITPHLNLEFGMGAWGGRYLKYSLYDCTENHELRDEGAGFFGKIDDISLSLCYVF